MLQSWTTVVAKCLYTTSHIKYQLFVKLKWFYHCYSTITPVKKYIAYWISHRLNQKRLFLWLSLILDNSCLVCKMWRSTYILHLDKLWVNGYYLLNCLSCFKLHWTKSLSLGLFNDIVLYHVVTAKENFVIANLLVLQCSITE